MIARCWELSKQRLEILLIFVLSMGFIYVSVEEFWTDSEMWAAVVAKYMFQNETYYTYAIKPLFNLLLWANYQWSLHLDLHPMVTGRFLMAFNGLLCVFLSWKIVLYITKNRSAAFVTAFLLLSLSTFVKRGGNVRSDILITSCILAGLYFQLIYSTKKPLLALVASTFFSLLTFLISPKAFLFSGPLLLYAFSSYFSKRKVIYSLLILSFVMIMVLPLASLNEDFKQYFLKSWLFFVHSFTQEEVGFGYFDPLRFVHAFRFLKENSFLAGSFGVFSIWQYFTLKKSRDFRWKWPLQKENSSVCFLFSTALLIFIFYPDRLPFLIASLLPFFCIFTGNLCASIWQNRKANFILIFICVVHFFYWGHRIVTEHSNKEQRLVADFLDREFSLVPELIVWDPAGILAHSHAQYYFVGPAQNEDNMRTFFSVRDYSMDVFLYTAKGFYVEPELSAFLKTHFYNMGGGVYIKNELHYKLNPSRLKHLEKQIAEGLKDKLLTKLFRFDFEY